MLPQHPLSLEHQDLPPYVAIRPVRRLMLALVGAAQVDQHGYGKSLGRVPEWIEHRIVERDERTARVSCPIAVLSTCPGLVLDLETGRPASDGVLEQPGDPGRVVRAPAPDEYVRGVIDRHVGE